MATPQEKTQQNIVQRLDHMLIQSEMQQAANDDHHQSNVKRMTTATKHQQQTNKILNGIGRILTATAKQATANTSEMLRNITQSSNTSTNRIVNTLGAIATKLTPVQPDTSPTDNKDFSRMHGEINNANGLSVMGNELSKKQIKALDAIHDMVMQTNDKPPALSSGFISGLFNKMFSYNQITDARKVKTDEANAKGQRAFNRELSAHNRKMLVQSKGEELTVLGSLLNGLKAAGGSIGSATKLLSKGGSAIGKSILSIAGMTSALGGSGGAISGLMSVVTGGLKNLATGITGLLKNFIMTTVSTVFGGIAKVARLLVMPQLMFAAIGAGLVYTIFSDSFDELFGALGNLLGDPAKRQIIYDKIGVFFSDIGNQIGEFFSTDNIDLSSLGVAGDVLTGAIDYLKSYWDTMHNVINGIVSMFKTVGIRFDNLGLAFDDMGLAISEIVSNAIRTVRDKLFLSTDDQDADLKVIAEKRKALDLQRAENDKRITAINETDHAANAVKAGVNAVMEHSSKVLNGIVDAGNSAIQNVTDGVNNLNADVEAQLKAQNKPPVMVPTTRPSMAPHVAVASVRADNAAVQRQAMASANIIQSSTNNVDNSSTTNLAAPMTSRQTFADVRPGSAL